jgi:hypothetical protein
MGHGKLEKVIEKPATSEKTTQVCERARPKEKIRVTSGSWGGETVVLKDQVLEVREPSRRPKVQFHDEWNSQSDDG